MPFPLRVLISHAHDEKPLAAAWRALLEQVSSGAILPWFSSDMQPQGGMQIGEEWRSNLHGRIEESHFVLAVLSPQTRDRPWILWECGVASGVEKDRKIVPIVFSMTKNDLANPLSSYQAYSGDERDDVIQVCSRLMHEAGLTKPQVELWTPAVDAYFDTIAAHRPNRARTLDEMALWRTRIEQLIASGRTTEVPTKRRAMYATFGAGFRPQDAQLHDLLSRVLTDLKRFDEALEEINRALELTPGDVELLHRRALCLAELHDLDEAITSVRQIIAIDATLGSNPEIAGLEGRIFRDKYQLTCERGDLVASQTAYRRAFEEHPESYFCGVNLAQLLLIGDERAEAEAVFESVLSSVRDEQAERSVSFWADFTAGQCLIGLGQLDNAINEYQKALTRDPAPAPRDVASARRNAISTAEARGFQQAEFSSLLAALGD